MLNAFQPKTPSLEDFRKELRRHSLKATRQRIAVHEAMMRLVHASADMVAEEVRKDGASVTVASVYNILSQLADCHIYARRLSGNNRMYFDVNNFRHVHLYDLENSRVRDVFDDELMDLITTRLRRRKFKGFTVEDIDIQLVARPTRKLKFP